jgi:AraC-like DNA-binding protein
MIILSIRVGKSVVIAFTVSLPMVYIYLGLCLMMFIGPLFSLYSKSLIEKPIKIKTSAYVHFIPGFIFMLLSVPMEKVGFRNIPVFVAAGLYIAIYVHYLSYLLYVKFRVIEGGNRILLSPEVKKWLNILFFGLIAIWFEYVLNLFEEKVPYILGPIVYSVTVYFITYLAFTKKYLTTVNTVKYQSATYTEEEVNYLFRTIQELMQGEKLFLDPNVTLASLGKQLMVSPQKISLVVNSKAGNNFNEYINRFRIDHAIDLINKPGSQTLTIAAISFDSGFNSLSSFNVAFKKFTGKTPSAYRKVQQ